MKYAQCKALSEKRNGLAGRETALAASSSKSQLITNIKAVQYQHNGTQKRQTKPLDWQLHPTTATTSCGCASIERHLMLWGVQMGQQENTCIRINNRISGKKWRVWGMEKQHLAALSSKSQLFKSSSTTWQIEHTPKKRHQITWVQILLDVAKNVKEYQNPSFKRAEIPLTSLLKSSNRKWTKQQEAEAQKTQLKVCVSERRTGKVVWSLLSRFCGLWWDHRVDLGESGEWTNTSLRQIKGNSNV